MLKNLLTVALRNLRKDVGYSLLNILGLTIGITCSLLLLLYVANELSYDRYHDKADRIYRVFTDIKEPEQEDHITFTQFPLGPALVKDYPEVEQSVRFVGGGSTLLKNGNQQFYEENIMYADSNLFEVFTYTFLEGNPKTALMAPNSIVLTRALAEKYFQTAANSLGKSLQSDGDHVYKVSAVIENVPLHSHLRFNALLPVSNLSADFLTQSNWGNFSLFTYVLLHPNTDFRALEKKMLPMYKTYMASIFAPYHVTMKYGLQPIVDIHLKSTLNGEPEELGSMSYIYIFSVVALFMVLIACINYMNLTTARSARRAKEIGIRKVAGSQQGQLIFQFLIESLVLTLVSLGLSLCVMYLLLPFFNEMSGKQLNGNMLLLQPVLWMGMLLIIGIVGLAGGAYPAFYLSRFNPVLVLKGNLSKGSSNTTLRKTLVVVQFTISMVMLISTWVVYDQLNFLKNKDLGYTKDQMVVVTVDPSKGRRHELDVLKNELRQHPHIEAVSTSRGIPGSSQNFILFEFEGKEGFTNAGSDTYGIDPFYLPTLGIQVVKGRNFTETDRSDSTRRMIVNEALVRKMGWKEPIGKKLRIAGDTTNLAEVVGVVKDFHQKSLYNPIEPLVLLYRENNNTIEVKVNPKDVPQTVAYIEKSFKKVFPQEVFQYTFLDQDFQSQFAADQKRGKIFTLFSTLTIAIACLGLLGLVAFTTEQRRKEISIRKVMGAEVGSLFMLISKSFLILVGISCILAFPIAWYFMHQWLESFPYKTDLKVTTFLISAGVVVCMTLLTVSYHTFQAAWTNPVKNLRSE